MYIRKSIYFNLRIFKNNLINVICSVSEQQTQYTFWKKAIHRSIGWNRDPDDHTDGYFDEF